MVNPAALMQMMSAWNIFKGNHPKFPAFVGTVAKQGVKEGSVIEISITDPDGQKITTNIKVQESDLQLFETIKNMNV